MADLQTEIAAADAERRAKSTSDRPAGQTYGKLVEQAYIYINVARVWTGCVSGAPDRLVQLFPESAAVRTSTRQGMYSVTLTACAAVSFQPTAVHK
jgi:hypothetical protein